MSRIDRTPGPTAPRRTEESDTQQPLQRHDPEFYRKKKDEGEQQGFRDPYEDLTDVSVPALRNFLLGLLDRDAAAAPAPQSAPAPVKPPADPQRAAAISAYNRTGQTASAPPPPPPPAPAKPASALDRAAMGLDRGEVLALIRDLDRLASDGIESIALEKSEGEGGFLGSIRAGIDRAREKAAGLTT